VTTGEREIEPAQASVVGRIFREFIAGVSPKQIAKNLNREGVPGPVRRPMESEHHLRQREAWNRILNNTFKAILLIGSLLTTRGTP
jgi:site-specific DNA recombinase